MQIFVIFVKLFLNYANLREEKAEVRNKGYRVGF